MTTTDDLTRFVRDALKRDVPRPQIEDVLANAGWSPAQIKGALTAYADIAFPIPVPRPRPYTDAREVFLYLVLFSSLYVAVLNFGGLIFAFIDHGFPPEGRVPVFLDEVASAVSVMIASIPVFLYTSHLVNREIRLDASKRVSEIRRKLTYLTLFVAACVVIGVAARIIYILISTAVTTRFVLQAITVGGIAGTVFGYYLRDLRLGDTEAKG